MKKAIFVSVLLAVLGFMGFFAQSVFATTTITTNGDSGDQNVDVPNDSNQNNSGITITVNGESDGEVVNTPSQSNQNSGGGSITNVVTSNSSNNTNEGNSAKPTAAPSSMPAENHSTPGQSTTKISNFPAVTTSISPLHSTAPTIAHIPHLDKPRNPLKFFSKIWSGITSIVSSFFHKSQVN